MNRRQFIGLFGSAIAWPTVAQAQNTMPMTEQTTTNPPLKGNSGKAKAKTKTKTDRHRHRGANKRLQNDRRKSRDYVYGKVHYRLKPAK
jgi:hypothetical protein